MIAFDVESHRIIPGCLAPKLVCASIHDGTETQLFLAKDSLPPFRRGLREGLVGANVSFDLAVMAAFYPKVLPEIFQALDEDKIYDVQLIEALHDLAKGCFYADPLTGAPSGYSLLELERRHLGISRDEEKHGPDAWRLRYAELDGTPLEDWPAEAVEYSRADAKGTAAVFYTQWERAKAGGNTEGVDANFLCIHDEVRAACVLHLASCYGIRTDELYVRKVAHTIRQEHEVSRKKFLEAGLVKLRKARGGAEPEEPDVVQDGRGWKYQTDTAVLKELVEKAYGRPPTTPTGRVSISRDTLAESGNELLEAFGEAGENEKLNSTYVEVLEQGTRVPINPRTRLLSTARVSYSKPNLTQLPRKGPIRECFVPRAGFVFLSVDYKTQELVTLAQTHLDWFGHSALADAINEEQDLHLRLAGEFLGIDYAEALKRSKAKDPEIKKLRQASKPINFGVPGLMGPPKIVYTARAQYDVRFCELVDGGKCSERPRVTGYAHRAIAPTCERCLELAVGLKRLNTETWVEMKDYFDVCIALAKECEGGQPFPSTGNGMLRLETNAGSVCNHFFQNRAAQASKAALYAVSKESYVGSGVLRDNFRPIVFAHDEIFGEAREEVLTECALEVVRIMETVMQERYTPGVLVKAEPAACRRWFKNAEPVWKDGRLTPWWPTDWAWEPDQERMRADQ